MVPPPRPVSFKSLMKKTFAGLMVLLVALPCVIQAGALRVRLTGDKLSVHADQVPLQTILVRLTDQGVRVRIDPHLNPTVSASFEDRDIQKGLETILKPLSHVLIWESIVGPSGPIPKLAEIQVFKPGERDLMKRLAKTNHLPVVRNPRDGSWFVTDEILLKLKPETGIQESMGILRRIGGTILESNAALGIYRIRLPEGSDVPSIVEKLTDPGIKRAEPNYAYPISVPYRGDLASEPVDASPRPVGTGVSAPVAVLDTGLRSDSGLDALVLASLDSLNPDEPISDSQGHGTQMALIAAGVVKPYGTEESPGAYTPIIAVRSVDDNGFTSSYEMIRSIDFALEHGARVMSLSWGSETRSEFLENALDYANSKNLVVVASAGNEPTGKPVYPAAYSSVVAVGALRPDGKPWEKSNYGDFVTVNAPGFAALPVGFHADPGIYAGTSIATAFVANWISNYLSQNPKATRQELMNALGDRFR